MATVSMSWRTVATLVSSRLSIVGGPSGDEGKNEGGLGAVPGMSIVGRVICPTGPRALDAGEETGPSTAGGGAELGRTGGLGGVGCGGGMGRRGLLTQSQSIYFCKGMRNTENPGDEQGVFSVALAPCRSAVGRGGGG